MAAPAKRHIADPQIPIEPSVPLVDHAAKLDLFAEANAHSGRVIALDPQYKHLPILIGRDGHPIPLYAFIEALDDATDYDAIQEAFPQLSFGQISGVFAFLRKLVQFNTANLDIDQLNDADFEASDEFRAQVQQALADEETTRVLTGNERHG